MNDVLWDVPAIEVSNVSLVDFKKGSVLQHQGELVTVVESLDLNTILVRTAHGHHVRIKIAELTAPFPQSKMPRTAPMDPVRARKVEKWRDAVQPLIGMPGRTRADVAAAADKIKCSVDAVYDALKRFELSQKLEDLAPPTRNGGRGKTRLSAQTEKIIEDSLKVLLTRRYHSKRFFHRKAKVALTKAGVTVSKSTLRARLDRIPPGEWFQAREGHSEARRRIAPLKGKHPEVQRPLQIVQMDHWIGDIEIYNRERTHLVGRPVLTFITCAKTKVFVGINVGFDPPGGIATSLALISMFTRKDALLEKHGLTGKVDWSFWGPPEMLATDNGADFTGNVVKTGCANYNITLSHRPPGAPQYGAFIERVNLNAAIWFKDLPGATGSNPTERKKLRPEMTAAFNLDDLEKHLIMLIDEYHDDSEHSGLGMSPRQAYRDYYFGPDGQKHDLPVARVDDLQLRVDWYPIEYRTIQRYGVMIDHLTYYGEELSSIVTNRVKGQKVEVRRNPYDVTEVYVRHPDTQRWMTVPCTSITYPRISIFEHDALLAAAKAARQDISPMALVEHFDAQQLHIQEAIKLTKKEQRKLARSDQHSEMRQNKPVTSKSPAATAPADDTAPANAFGIHEKPKATTFDSPWVVPAHLTEQYLMDRLDD